MLVGELLYRIAEHGAGLPGLAVELEEHKQEIIRVLGEDGEYRRAGTNRCERRVFEPAWGFSAKTNEEAQHEGLEGLGASARRAGEGGA